MAETKVIGARVGADVVKTIFSNVRVRYTSTTSVTVKSGTSVGADDGTDTLTASGDVIISVSASGVDGLDTGSVAANTWYYIWLIKKPGTTVHGLLSTSYTSPTMPTDYTIKRIVGAVRTNAISNFLPFNQVGNHVRTSTIMTLYHGTATTYTTIPLNLYTEPGGVPYVPYNIATKIDLGVFMYTESIANTMSGWIKNPSDDDNVCARVFAYGSLNGNGQTGFTVFCDGSGNIAYRVSDAGNSWMDLHIQGFFIDI